MRVYHASDTKIDRPDNLHSRNALDFGKGFYVTRLKDQAYKYARRFTAMGNDAYIHEYEFTQCTDLKLKVFESYDEDWLNFVCMCRQGDESYKAFDIVMGGVANDKVYRTVEMYMAGYYTKEQALQQLIFEKPNHQICLISQSAIDRCLAFVDCTVIKADTNG